MKKYSLRTLCAALTLSTALGLTACSTTPFTNTLRDQTAARLAMPSRMVKREIPAGPFLLTSYERILKPGAPVTVYIEGDGLAWLSRVRPSLDPTPDNPVALHLATRDNGPNVVWLARPCQYTKMTTAQACPDAYWTGKRFAPEVLDSMNAALDGIKARAGGGEINLVGYSGGATVAALMAETRDDIASLRTVAGNLDTEAFTRLHNVSPMPESLNPVVDAAQAADVPQHHFIGAWDNTVPPVIYESFRRASGPTHCIRAMIVDGATHEAGWVDKWPDLLVAPLDCAAE